MPLLLDIAESQRPRLSIDQLNVELARVRKALFQDLGVPFPGVHLRFNKQLSDGYAVYLQEVPVAQGQLRDGHVLVCEPPDRLDMLAIPHRNGTSAG